MYRKNGQITIIKQIIIIVPNIFVKYASFKFKITFFFFALYRLGVYFFVCVLKIMNHRNDFKIFRINVVVFYNLSDKNNSYNKQ